MRKIIFTAILLILVAVGYFYFFQEHRDIAGEKEAYAVEAKSFSNEYVSAPSIFEEKYLNKTISVTGKVTEFDSSYIVMDEKIFCQLLVPNNDLQISQEITIKGRVIGYDDLLEQVKLDQCSLIN